MPSKIEGVVVAYSNMHGVVLLRHRKNKSLEELADLYAKSKSDKGFWFAKFTWADILIAQRKKFDSSKLFGSPVLCDVLKAPKWRCISVSLIRGSRPLVLPTRRYIADEMSKATHSEWNSPGDQRARQLGKRSPNNLFRPWGGMTN